MTINGIEKPAYVCSIPWRTSQISFSSIWKEWNPKVAFFTKSKEQLLKDITSKKGTLQNGNKLYFDPDSVYPKFKLSETSFKRCIKLNNADIVVVPKFDITEQNYYIWSTADAYYLSYNYTGHSYGGECFNEIEKIGFLKWLRKYNLIAADMQLIHEGKCTSVKNDGAECKIVYGTYIKYVTDEELDEEVNKVLSELTEDEFKSILTLTQSTDINNQELALRLLNGYNLNPVKNAVKLLIELHSSFKNCSAWNSIGMKRIRENLNPRFKNIEWISDLDTTSFNEIEKKYAKMIITSEIIHVMNIRLDKFKDQSYYNDLGIRISINEN